MAKTLLAQYVGDAIVTAFTVPSITAGYVPVVEVDGEPTVFTYAANTATISPAPAAHSIVNIFQTNAIIEVKEVYTDKLRDVVAAVQSDAGSFSTPNCSTQAYIKTDNGTKTLLASSAVDRIVLIVVRITTAFATGDGAKPTVSFGETSAVTKFAATSVIVTAAAEQIFTFTGTNTAGTAVLATLVAGTGTTETGAYTVNVFAFPALA